MSTWKYGPKVIEEGGESFTPYENVTYSVEYQTCADSLGVIRNGSMIMSLGYDAARVIGKFITQWYLEYEHGYSREFTDKLFNGEIKE